QADRMSNRSGKLLGRILDPMERISEILFGVIMALTFTCALGVATANSINVSTMLLGVFGCNLAWGIIDGGVYLVERIYDQGRNIRMLRAMHEAVDTGAARRIIFEALPPLLASTLSEEQLESMRRKLHQMPNLPERPQLTRRDAFAALGVCLLCFLSTLPIALPFMIISDARLALRISNVIAVAMLIFCGYAFAHRSGLQPWTTALSMVVFGGAMVGVAMALGG
ncbi:MAG: VIT1/CCC1 transporter family protein, partial [Beijerinckiaceae bacterium]